MHEAKMLTGDDLTIVLFLVGTAITIALAAINGAGWKHRALVVLLFALALAFLVVGLAWPLVDLKTLSPSIVESIEQISRSPVAWFVVLMVAIGSSFRRSSEGASAYGVRPSQLVAAQIDSLVENKPGPETSPETSTPLQSLNSGELTAKNLAALFSGKTSLHANALIKPYLGKRMSVSGKVGDVSHLHKGSISLIIRGNDGELVRADFNQDKVEAVSFLRKEAEVTVSGELVGVNIISIILQDCDIISMS
jgi:hypothetical protein